MLYLLFLQTIFLQAIDAFITYFSVSSGAVKEINPTMSFLISVGWEYFFLFKAIGTLLILVLAYNMKPKKVQIGTLLLINIAYIFIFAWNIKQILG